MIHLDTNILIRLTSRDTEFGWARRWLEAGERLAVSAVAWSEFLNGPVTAEQIREANFVVEGRIVAFDVMEAAKAAELFNRLGRRRTSRFDCFIAATALCARASLATENRKDFLPFVEAGLRLEGLSRR